MNFIGKIIFSLGLSISSFFGFHQSQSFTASSFTPVQASQFTLAGAGITSSQNTVQLTSFTLPDPSKTPITMSMFGSIGYAVLEPQTSKIENITFTGVTQNANGSAILTGVTRGISFYSPYLSSTTLAMAHAGGAYVILTNSAAFYGKEFLFANNAGTSTQSVVVSSTTPWRYDLVPLNQANGTYVSTTSEFASVALVNKVVASGCATATEGVLGCSQLATQLQMASSSYSVGTPTVLYSRYSTSSPTVCGLCIPITRNNGTIHPNFIATSTNDFYNFGNFSTASTSMTATTTISANSLTNGAFRLNGLAYLFPSLRGAVGTVLTENGSGTLSWSSTGGKIYSYASTTNPLIITGPSFATSTPLNIPAGVMTASSTIDVYATIRCNGGGGSSSCSFWVTDVTGAPFISSVSTIPAPASGNTSGNVHVQILANNSTSAQRTVALGTFAQVAGTISSAGQASIESTGSSAINLANAFGIYFVIKGTDANATMFLTSISFVVNP